MLKLCWSCFVLSSYGKFCYMTANPSLNFHLMQSRHPSISTYRGTTCNEDIKISQVINELKRRLRFKKYVIKLLNYNIFSMLNRHSDTILSSFLQASFRFVLILINKWIWWLSVTIIALVTTDFIICRICTTSWFL